MKFTYNWLKQYVDFEWSTEELAEKLTFAGIEVEDIQTLGGKIPEQVIIAQILASEKHPNADKLSICRVNDGTSERQIVCGAKNYKVGDKVPLALPGAAMAAGFTIKVSKLRGVESQGMMCSTEELGLPKGEDGLLILPVDAPLGKKFVEYVGPGDTVFDIEVTPNRPDWLSVIGIAREIAALTGNPLRLPEAVITEGIEAMANVSLEAPDLCPRYTARIIKGVKVGTSPAWLKSILEKVGMRSINNVVDITNYVLLETGHPLHAFDLNLLKGNQVIVRRAQAGELFTAIVDSRHELTSEMLVIADTDRAVALAGIMGGKNSEINESTTDVLLESAWFLPASVRKTSKKIGLASDSSYRFERGADIGGVIWASNRAAALIQQLAGGQVARGITDVLAKPLVKRRVACRYAQVNRLLGIEVPAGMVKKIFVGLGMSVVKDEPTDVEVEVPTFRVDLEREADLIEEVCRIYGVEKVPAAMLPSTAQVSAFDAQWDARRRVREILNALGFHEALNQTMTEDVPFTNLLANPVSLLNPLNADQGKLRANLLPGLLRNLQTNVSRHQFDLRLFEIGRVFDVGGKEEWRLSLVATGLRHPSSWEATAKKVDLDYFDIRGAVQELADQLGVQMELTKHENSTDDNKFNLIKVTGEVVGRVERVPLALAKEVFDLRQPVFFAEMKLEPLLTTWRQLRTFRELPRFPAVVRDMALIVAEEVRHADVLAAVEKCRSNNLESVELFDIFRGGQIPTGKKSVAYSLTFRAADRTLTDAEVNAAHEQLKRQLQQALPCEIREG